MTACTTEARRRKIPDPSSRPDLIRASTSFACAKSVDRRVKPGDDGLWDPETNRWSRNSRAMFIPQEIIRRKRDGAELGEDEIAAFVRGFRDGSIAEGQIAAFAMAVFFRGMSRAETTALTRAMKRSGEVLEWSDLALNGPLLDKHSTGGVGDKTSLMVAPIVAACGGFVPMIAGRGLGHTGGTVDKLESIPGYRSSPAIGEFRHAVREA